MELIEKHFQEIMNGKMPKEVQEAFGHEGEELDFDKMFSSLSAEVGISKKGTFL